MRVVSVIGPTNVGKSTFIETVGGREDVAIVQVGKLLRAKYGEAFFNGQGAPINTAEEAWQLMLNAVGQAFIGGKRFCVIDGQPRDIGQAEGMIKLFGPSLDVINLVCPHKVRLKRATERDHGNAEKLNLSLSRMGKDPLDLYEVLAILMPADVPIVTIDTNKFDFSAMAEFENAIECFKRVQGLRS